MSNLHANFITSGKAGLWSKLQPVYLYKSKKKLGRELKLITKNLKYPKHLRSEQTKSRQWSYKREVGVNDRFDFSTITLAVTI